MIKPIDLLTYINNLISKYYRNVNDLFNVAFFLKVNLKTKLFKVNKLVKVA